jgi:diguanylate cyclase (GGDEF)-like protein
MPVLVVDDHHSSAAFLQRTLEELGYQVATASDGEEAWSLLGTHQHRLVISDWRMPGLDGLELCRRIRGQSPGRYTYIVLVTGKGGDEDRVTALDAGADDFLAKPIDVRELTARLKIARRILAMQEELEWKNAQLLEMATTDPLTGLKNRRWFAEAFEAHAAQAVRHGQPLSLVLLDVDHFKAFNDDFGHPMGDGTLRAVAQVLSENVRRYDVVARYGGEEFAILLPSTDSDAALMLGERIRAAVERVEWPIRPVTVSVGVSTLSRSRPGSADLLVEADQALYQAKRSGRNRVCRFEPRNGRG